jgi:hypothetical protein
MACNGRALPLHLQDTIAQIFEKWRLGKIVTNSVHDWLNEAKSVRTGRGLGLYEIQNCSQKPKFHYCVYNIILSQFTLFHSITPHFEIHSDIIPMSVIFIHVISILLDCPTNMWYSVLLYSYYSPGRGRH